MKTTLIELHQAAQYLSAAGISFVNHQADDSHTNLGWDTKNKRLLTHYLSSKKYQLALSIESGNLEWLRNGRSEDSIKLSDSTHLDNLNWIKSQAKMRGLKDYKFEFHYELPYPQLDKDHVFSFDPEAIGLIANSWDIGYEAFEKLLVDWKFDSSIRVWSHHFDLGVYVQLDKAATLFIGGGLAIPDSLVDDLYYYVSGWKNGVAVKTKSFGTLNIGEWRSDWNGATLPASNMNVNLVNLFLKITLEVFLENNLAEIANRK
ncbi:MAG: hypothetical protein ACI8ZM_004012 [Crocinitomix sp.]|jgi:hypothetical protein